MSRCGSWNLNDINYDKQINGQIKLIEKESTCVENWSERIDFIRKATQEVAKKLKNYEDACNKEENKLTQHRLDEYSMQQERYPDTVSQLMTQKRELQDKVNFLSDEREFHDPDSGSSSGRSHVPYQHRITSSSRRNPSRDSGVPRNTGNDMSIRGKVFEDLPAQGHPKEFFKSSKN